MKRCYRALATAGMAIMLIGSQALAVSADTAKDLANAKAEKAQTSSALSTLNGQIDDLETKKQQITGEINSLDAQLVTTIATINDLDNQITDKEADLEKTGKELEQAQGEQNTQYDAMKKRIQYIYENGGEAGWATIILEKGNISAFVDNVQNTQQMYEYDRECLEEYAETVQQVSDLQEQQLSEKADLVGLKVEQEDAKTNLEGLLSQAKATSADYDAQLASVNEKAAEYESLLAEQNQKISELVQKQQEEQEAAAAAAAQAAQQAQQAQQAQSQAAAQQSTASQQTSSNQNSGSSSQQTATTGQTQTSTGGSSQQQAVQTGGSSSSAGSASTGSTVSSGSSNSSLGQQIVNYALQFVGNPYVYGGNSLTNGIDCSGFVQQVFAHFGISLSRTTYSQLNEGVAVSVSDLQPGDVINYGSHTAIYTGSGIVHASNERDGIKISSNPFYRTVVGIRRYY